MAEWNIGLVTGVLHSKGALRRGWIPPVQGPVKMGRAGAISRWTGRETIFKYSLLPFATAPQGGGAVRGVRTGFFVFDLAVVAGFFGGLDES